MAGCRCSNNNYCALPVSPPFSPSSFPSIFIPLPHSLIVFFLVLAHSLLSQKQPQLKPASPVISNQKRSNKSEVKFWLHLGRESIFSGSSGRYALGNTLGHGDWGLWEDFVNYMECSCWGDNIPILHLYKTCHLMVESYTYLKIIHNIF